MLFRSDFAAKNNIGAILVEGWNEGWEKWGNVADRESTFSYVTPYPDYDLKEVVRYGKEKGVDLIMHHETAGTPRAYERQLDTAYALMKSLDIHAVKTGYVGKILPDGEYHHGQWMVNHYQKVLETAAKYGNDLPSTVRDDTRHPEESFPRNRSLQHGPKRDDFQLSRIL